MSTRISVKQSFSLLGGAIATLLKNPKIFYPFAISAFVQLLFMEILFFSTRSPLANFFRPIIVRLKGETYMHYPFNFDLANHWFQSAQVIIFLFISSFIAGVAVIMIAKLNKGEGLGESLPKLRGRQYVNLVVAFIVILTAMYGLTSLYGILVRRALQIRSTTGIYFLIKQAVLIGMPYFNLLFSIIVATLFAYIIPVIVLERENVFIALSKNFRILWPSAAPLFIVISISSLFYVPILLVKSNYQWFSSFMNPESWQVFVIFALFVRLFIDAVQYMVITTCYLLTKDE